MSAIFFAMMVIGGSMALTGLLLSVVLVVGPQSFLTWLMAHAPVRRDGGEQ